MSPFLFLRASYANVRGDEKAPKDISVALQQLFCELYDHTNSKARKQES